ncbi:MAG: condensation domain-containing protein, partial [Pyrinomonadaceae bacterium]
MRKENPIADIYPLSPLQQGMLFHCLYATRKEVYFEHLSFTIEGPLDAHAFKRTWAQLIERHGVLRTAFIWGRREEPLQVVFKSGKLEWHEDDWRGLETETREAHLKALLRDERAAGFDLARLPLMKFSLLRMADDTHQFVWHYHHLLLDGWSVSLLLKELFTLYDAARLGLDPGLTTPRPYGNYISWLKQQNLGEAEAHWRRVLKGFVAPTPLALAPPTASLPADEEAYRTQSICVSADTTAALRALARSRQLTLNTFMQGAMALLLGRYSGESDVVFGTTVAGRPPELEGVESMVGLFINTIPVRVRLAESQPVLSWLRELQAQQIESRSFEYSPLVAIQSWSSVPRGTPLFDSLLVFENYPTAHSARRPADDLHIHNVHAEDWSDYGLTLSAWLTTELTLRLAYDGNRFADSAIAQLLAHFRRVLEAFTDEEVAVGEVELLSSKERHRLITEWGTHTTEFPRHSTLATLFAQQVEARPSAVAVVSGDAHLTYAALAGRAYRLSRHLRRLGVGRNTRVGLCLTRGTALIEALVGIVVAGAAYVPLDPSYPLERLSFMLEDSGVGVVVTAGELAERLPSSFYGQVVCTEAEAEQMVGYSSQMPVESAGSEDVAYVSYTSGSTGVPKGVEVCQRGIVRLLCGGGYARLDESRRLLHHSPLAFDASTFEVWGALLHGGCCVLMGAGVMTTPEELGRVIGEERVTTLWLTAALLNAVVEAGAGGVLGGVEEVLAGGEALSGRHVRRAVRELGAGVHVTNGYG